jgi:hypothetical protein
MKKLFAIGTTMLTVFLIAPGLARASIVDLATLLSGVDAAQAVDPTLNAPPNDGAHDFAVGGGQHDDLAGTFPPATNRGAVAGAQRRLAIDADLA